MGGGRDDEPESDECCGEADQSSIDADEVLEEMEPLQPYTTTKLADLLDVPRDLVRRLLKTLYDESAVERKSAATTGKPIIWVRPPPLHTCPKCGREFRVRFAHPVLGAVQFCPRCGTQLSGGRRS